MSLKQLTILVTGSRVWHDRAVVYDTLQAYRWYDVTLMHGGARGVDALAAEIAHGLRWKVELRLPDYHRVSEYGRAPLLRNMAMVQWMKSRGGPKLCLAFWDGRSSGTLDCIQRSVEAGIEVRIIPDRP